MRITDRLKKIEGQVRGVRKMIDEGRYCLDEIQQANAIVAAMREVELLIISDHLEAGMEFAVDFEGQGCRGERHDDCIKVSSPKIGGSHPS